MEFILLGRSPHVSRKQAFELRIGQTGKVVTTIAEKSPDGERRNLNQTGNSQKRLKLNGKSPPPETTTGLCGIEVGTTEFEPLNPASAVTLASVRRSDTPTQATSSLTRGRSTTATGVSFRPPPAVDSWNAGRTPQATAGAEVEGNR